MRKLAVFNNITLDGFFAGEKGDFSWAQRAPNDPEFDAFTAANASRGGSQVFGRITYDMMAAFWPTPQAEQMMPVVAEGMNKAEKFVFSRTMGGAAWRNTTLLKGEIVAEVRKLKGASGSDMVIMGSGSIVAQLAPHGLIDEYQFVVVPVAIGKGRTMFDGVTAPLSLKLIESRNFANGKIFLRYQPV